MNDQPTTSRCALAALFGPPRHIDRVQCALGERRWNEWCAKYAPGVRLMTPKTDTLEQMAGATEIGFAKLVQRELRANHVRLQPNNPVCHAETQPQPKHLTPQRR